MTTKPARPAIESSAADDQTAAPMMTIPDFSWQPSLLERPPSPPAEDPANRVDGPSDQSTLITTPAMERRSCISSPCASTQEPGRTNSVMLRGASAMVSHLRLLKSWKRHWLPVGGVAIAVLWLGSVFLTDRSQPEKTPPLSRPRQAKRESSPARQRIVKGRPRTPASNPQPMHRTASVPAAPSTDTPSPEGQDELFGKVPTLGGFTASDGAPSEPDPSPSLSGPTGATKPAEVPELQAPLVAPANPPNSGVVDEPEGVRAPPRTAARRDVGRSVPTADRAAARSETEYEWGTPISPSAEMRVTRRNENPAAKSVVAPPTDRPAADGAAGGSSTSQYPRTDPSTYKDPLYEIPPLARQPRRARR